MPFISSQSQSFVEDNLEPNWRPHLGHSSGWSGYNSRALSRDSVGWRRANWGFDSLLPITKANPKNKNRFPPSVVASLSKNVRMFRVFLCLMMAGRPHESDFLRSLNSAAVHSLRELEEFRGSDRSQRCCFLGSYLTRISYNPQTHRDLHASHLLCLSRLPVSHVS